MTPEQQDANRRAQALHLEEQREKAIADTLPDGDERDAHFMRGERLSDEAWSIEEEHDLDPQESGLWAK